jgi:peptidoglycan/xylan/chitin deacetylase (PgdA/CDA1 family)
MLTEFIRKFVKEFLIMLFCLAGLFFKSKGTPVFVYHSVDGSGSLISISEAMFQRQMQYLHKKGYQTISLDNLVRTQTRKSPLPKRPIVLTFDDGYKNNRKIVMPILERFGFTATIFITTGYVSKIMTWTKTPDIPDLPMASWDDIRVMSEGGMHIQAHSINHPNLCLLPIEEAVYEMKKSKEEIEEHLGKEVNFFAYPYGEYNEEIKNAAKECGYKGAVTTIFGKENRVKDTYEIKRIDPTGISGVSDFTKMQFFKACLAGTADWYMGLKRIFPGLTKKVDTPWAE